MKVVAVVQARMGSSRLPGKVLLSVQGKPLLEHLLARLQRCRRLSEVVVATTRERADEPIEQLCRQLGEACYRGSELDVLSRFQEAARWRAAEAVVRITADCPLLDPEVVDRVVEFFQQGRFDYVSNCLTRSYPRGLDTEVFSAGALEVAWREAGLDFEREHVTPFFYRHPERFALGQVASAVDLSHHRWTVDTPVDLELIRRIYASLYPVQPDFLMKDVLALLEENPDWPMLNREVVQKALPE